MRGSVESGNATSIEVTGLVHDPSGVRVTVNSQPAAIAADGSFRVVVPTYAGLTLLHTVAYDPRGNRSADTRAVLGGPLASADTPVANGVVARLDARAVRVAGQVAAYRVAAIDFAARLERHNPIFENPIPCVRARADLNRLVHGSVRLDLWPVDGGLGVDAEVQDLGMDLSVLYSDSCTTVRTKAVTASATRFRFRGKVQFGLDGVGQVVANREDVDYGLEDFGLDSAQLPDDVIYGLEEPFAEALGELVADEIADQVPSAILRGLGASDRVVTVGGFNLEIVLRPTELHFDSYGVSVAVDSSVRMAGGAGALYLATAHPRPALDPGRALAVGVADSTLNQLVASLWNVGRLDAELAGGNVAGVAFDSVELASRLPPQLTALQGGGGLRLTIGDVEANFMKKRATGGSEIVARLSLSAEMVLGVAVAAGKIGLTALGQRLYVDSLRDLEFDQHVFAPAALDSAGQLVADSLLRSLGEVLTLVPLPASSGIMTLNANQWGAWPEDGYLLMSGD